MTGFLWIILALVVFFISVLKTTNARAFLGTLMVSFIFTMLTAYLDKDTQGISTIFSVGYLLVGIVYTINVAGLTSLLRFLNVKTAWAYISLFTITLFVQLLLTFSGYMDYAGLLGFTIDTVFFFAYLSAVYFVSGIFNKYISNRDTSELKHLQPTKGYEIDYYA